MQRAPATKCKTTKLCRACELEHNVMLKSINGPIGRGPRTSIALLVGVSINPTDLTFLNIAAAVMATYAPSYKKNSASVFS